MAGRDQRESEQSLAGLSKRYLWWQYAGMGIFLSWPVAIQLAGYLRLNIRLDVLSVLMVIVAAVVFAIGHYGRQELKERNR